MPLICYTRKKCDATAPKISSVITEGSSASSSQLEAVEAEEEHRRKLAACADQWDSISEGF